MFLMGAFLPGMAGGEQEVRAAFGGSIRICSPDGSSLIAEVTDVVVNRNRNGETGVCLAIILPEPESHIAAESVISTVA